MPETPILSKKEQKLSLSAKKTRTKETIRNVLASPYTKYWPLISSEHVADLHKVLSNHLPRLLSEKVRIPWNQFKDVPRSERKSFREVYLEKHTLESKKLIVGQKDGLVFGINDTSRGIEKGIVKSVLITEDVQPKLMVEHLIDQSVLLRIPILVVPGLRDLLSKTCGFSSIAIAFTGLEKYQPVQEIIESVYEKHPVPRDHINFQRSLDLLNSSVIVLEDTVLGDTMNEPSKLIQNSNTKIEHFVVEPENVYLYRKTKDKRIFIPEKSGAHVENNSKMQVDSTGFLSFSTDSTSITKKEYKSLSVKKIKGNVHRDKRKVQDIKQRLKSKKCKNIRYHDTHSKGVPLN